jgi:hypothetical protein
VEIGNWHVHIVQVGRHGLVTGTALNGDTVAGGYLGFQQYWECLRDLVTGGESILVSGRRIENAHRRCNCSFSGGFENQKMRRISCHLQLLIAQSCHYGRKLIVLVYIHFEGFLTINSKEKMSFIDC